MKEANVHQQVVNYLKLQYPKVIFRTDFAAGVKMSMGQSIKHAKLQHSSGFPDLFIAMPNKHYHGLFIELKKDGVTVFKKDGTIRKNEHLEKQNEVHQSLNSVGYFATFAIGFDEAKKIINEYLTTK